MPERLSAHTYYRASCSPDTYPALSGARECAVCIIGAGFAGLGTAMSLAERGERDVVVLEAEEVGHGASGRNGGFVFGGFSLGERALQRSAGRSARRLYGDTLAAVNLIRKRIARHEIDCDVQESGVILANWFDDDRILLEQQRFMAEHMGVEWRHIGRAELADQLRTTRYRGGLFEPDAFHFHPLRYAQGLARTLARQGVAIHEHSRVTGLKRTQGGWLVSTGHGTVSAREVVVCCGGYLASLHRRLRAAILPIATYVMSTEPLGERLASSIRTRAAVYDTRFAFDYYRVLPDTRLLWGGRISILHRSPRAVARLLYGDMLRVYPQLAGLRVEHAWSGLMSYARHKMPQVGRLPDGLWYGMGFGGHGVAPTTLAGELLGGALTGEPGPLRQYARWGLPWTGGPAGLAAAQATYWYYGLRDLLRR
ncbi:FAD-dependent oxidoreductase [Massilia sp. KIM]|uniref:NAD(P)/FAD-dependent oxidoreductase n=1 Tax=Massilia sp. KIM TaxID=1955422 RepID=UPI00098E8AFF|nr:FAD-binding oxidoreductase [Massilia sp. KIM]OON62980.1 FAD-dependent oxidoreductase [Massilia sp. KIM]